MRNAMAAALLSCAAQACGPAAPSNGSEQQTASAAAAPPPAEIEERREDVYVAFAPQRDAASPLAIYGGRLEVLDRCLVLRSGTGLHLPVFSPSADTYVTHSSAVIAGRAVPLGTEIQVTGGEMGIAADRVLTQPRPPGCSHRLWRVTSWHVPRRGTRGQ